MSSVVIALVSLEGHSHCLAEAKARDFAIEDVDGFLSDLHEFIGLRVDVQWLTGDDPCFIDGRGSLHGALPEDTHGIVIGPENVKWRIFSHEGWEDNLKGTVVGRWVLQSALTVDTCSGSQISFSVISLRGGVDSDVGCVNWAVDSCCTITLAWSDFSAVKLVPKTGVF